MPILTYDHVQAFAEQGCLVVPGLVGAPDLERAEAEVERVIAAAPPPAGHAGHHFYWPGRDDSPVLFGLPSRPGGILAAAAELTGDPRTEVAFAQTQVALNIPPYPHRPGRPHIDGYQAGQDVPGTFTMLAGLLLTDQTRDNCGNLWVWPGTHRTHAAFFATHGPGAFATAGGNPDVELPEPVQVHGRRGDVLLAHYLLGHNIGGNFESEQIRRALYWRLRGAGHAEQWTDCLTDAWHEYPVIRYLGQRS
ncbi:MAG TPA: phytanoyl-CoA dioxygenase family protein [Streptosporangiaceae bacterium]|nr:phytanoyl-CoA dioxygenase family protein [Streptosporangiaceae bacterium]